MTFWTAESLSIAQDARLTDAGYSTSAVLSHTGTLLPENRVRDRLEQLCENSPLLHCN